MIVLSGANIQSLLRHRAADFDNGAHRLMAEEVAFFPSHHKPFVKMEIRSANRGRGDV